MREAMPILALSLRSLSIAGVVVVRGIQGSFLLNLLAHSMSRYFFSYNMA